jgi:hypothetical protein
MVVFGLPKAISSSIGRNGVVGAGGKSDEGDVILTGWGLTAQLEPYLLPTLQCPSSGHHSLSVAINNMNWGVKT